MAASDVIQYDSGGRRYVQGVGSKPHRDGHAVRTGRNHFRGKPVAFAPEYKGRAAAEPRRGQRLRRPVEDGRNRFDRVSLV